MLKAARIVVSHEFSWDVTHEVNAWLQLVGLHSACSFVFAFGKAVTEWSSIIEKVLKEVQICRCFFLHVKNHSQHSQTLESISSALASPLTSWPFSAGRWKRQRKREHEPSSDGRDRLLEGSLLQSFDRLRTASTTRCEKGWIQSLWEESWGVVSLRYTVIGIWLPPMLPNSAFESSSSPNFLSEVLEVLEASEPPVLQQFQDRSWIQELDPVAVQVVQPMIPMTHYKCSVPQKTTLWWTNIAMENHHF